MGENKEKSILSKVAIVTGGSRGIGSEIVRMLAREDYQVILNYNKSEKEAKKIQQELLEEGKQIEIFKADVSKRKEIEELVKFTVDKYYKVDILINNAGIAQEKLFTEITDTDWNNMIETNLNSVFYCTQEVLKNMVKRQKGCIINISSIWGVTGGSCEVAYSTTKAAINGLTKALAKEFGPSHIRINSIAPGIINTEMNKNLTKQDMEDIKTEIPLERIGKPEDIAKCVKWLIEDSYTTGQIISVNGGWYI